MKNLFVPHNIAELARKFGFDEPCLGYYDQVGFDSIQFEYNCNRSKSIWYNNNGDAFPNVCSAPTYGQLTDWFRRHKWMEITVHTEWSTNEILGYYFQIYGLMSSPVMKIQEPVYTHEYWEVWDEAFAHAFAIIDSANKKS
jgi:hypothetical protein